MTQTFTLKYPVELKGVTTAELTLRRPKNRDIEALETRKGGATAKSMQMIADLAGVEPDLIRELDVEDMNTIGEWLEPILDPKGQASRGGGS